MAYLFSGDDADAIVAEWVREVLERRYGVQDPVELPRARRAVVLQRLVGVLLALQDMGEIAFMVGLRREVAAVFARYFDGIALDGPPWRLDPFEQRPSYREWSSSSDFGEVD